MMATANLLPEASSRRMYRRRLHEDDSIAGRSFAINDVKRLILAIG